MAIEWDDLPGLDLKALVVVTEILPGACGNEFSMLAVWRHTGSEKLYWASGEHCSCNDSAFEDYELSEFNELTDDSYEEFERQVEAYAAVDKEALEVEGLCSEVAMVPSRIKALLTPQS